MDKIDIGFLRKCEVHFYLSSLLPVAEGRCCLLPRILYLTPDGNCYTPYSLLPTPYSLKIKNSVPHPSEKCYKYREIIKKLIQEYAGDRYTRKDVDRELIFDTKNDHYQIVNVGWENNHRVYGCIRHFDIKQGKIWLQYNGTEIDFAEELVKAEVPNQDIVIGFHSPIL